MKKGVQDFEPKMEDELFWVNFNCKIIQPLEHNRFECNLATLSPNGMSALETK